MNERDRQAADDWMRDHLPDAAEYSLEDNEEEGATQSYFFLRHRDSATVVYKVAVKDAPENDYQNRVVRFRGLSASGPVISFTRERRLKQLLHRSRPVTRLESRSEGTEADRPPQPSSAKSLWRTGDSLCASTSGPRAPR